MPHREPAPDDRPVDHSDPRFHASAGAGAPQQQRQLVPSRGPGPSHEDPQVRRIRIALPLVFFAAIVVIGTIFFQGLQPGEQHEVIGPEAQVRAAVAQRPKRVCLNGNNPCAWITTVDGHLVAFSTNGPLPQEYGRDGVGWCASSRWFGANVTGSRFDQRGRPVGGPAPRGLDRFGVSVDDGVVRVNFTALTTGLQRDQVREETPPEGPHCPTIPFDRDADLTRPGG